jgi:hypothetical protein
VTRIPKGFLYTPGDLGLNAVNVAAAGTIVTGNVVPLMNLGNIQAVSLIKEQAAAGGTPGDVLFASVNVANVQWSDGLVQSSLWAAFTNNPRTQFGRWASGQTTALLTSGSSNAGEFAKLLSSPYGRFAFRNNDAALASVLSLTVILWTLEG